MRRFHWLGMTAAAAVAALGLASASTAGPSACATRTNNTHAKLQECVTLDGVRAHQSALQAIASANGNTRVSGSPGYDLSADYAESAFRAAGYNVTRQEFQFQTFVSLQPSILERIAPLPAGPIPNSIMSYSGSGADVSLK